MKTRMLMLVMSVFAVTPALLGSAFAGYVRSSEAISTEARECSLRAAKSLPKIVKKNDKNQDQQNDALIPR